MDFQLSVNIPQNTILNFVVLIVKLSWQIGVFEPFNYGCEIFDLVEEDGEHSVVHERRVQR